MLPKHERTKKNRSPEQLDLVESISAEDKLKQKRRFLFIAIFSTIGLSFIFSTFRFLQTFSLSNFSFRVPSFYLPQLSQTIDPQKQLDADLNRLLSPDLGRWHISISSPNNAQFHWSYNSSTLNFPLPTTSLGIIKNVLPQGIDIKESLVSEATFSQYSALISLPKNQFLITIKNDDNNLEKFKNTIPLIVETLYWSLLKSL